MGHLAWPFFTDAHREFALELESWAADRIAPLVADEPEDVDATFREIVRRLGAGGWLRYAVPKPYGLAPARLDVRTLCIARETLGQLSGMADFAFGMQGLGSGPISQYGSDELKRRYLPRVASGEAIAAFALSEPDAGSDVSSMQTTARRDGADLVLDGRKTWISNAGIADFYVVVARVEGVEKGFVAVVVDADNPGLTVSERIVVNAPHPLGIAVAPRRPAGSALHAAPSGADSPSISSPFRATRNHPPWSECKPGPMLSVAPVPPWAVMVLLEVSLTPVIVTV